MPTYLQKNLTWIVKRKQKNYFTFFYISAINADFPRHSVTFFSILPGKVNFLEECVRDVRP